MSVVVWFCGGFSFVLYCVFCCCGGGVCFVFLNNGVSQMSFRDQC